MAAAMLRRIPDVVLRRDEKRLQPGCLFVDAQQFRSLLVSTRRLIRADDLAARLKGLRDPATGESFVTEEEKLFA